MSHQTSSVPCLRVIHSPRYFPLCLGQIVSNLGDTLNYVALVVLVFRLSHSGLAVSALVVAEIVPTLLLEGDTARAPRKGTGEDSCMHQQRRATDDQADLQHDELAGPA